MNERYKDKYRIKTVRHPVLGYNGGGYHVVICTKYGRSFFGNVVDSQMILSEFGRYVMDELHNITSHYPYAQAIEFCVMPNHIHILFILEYTEIDHTRESISPQKGTLAVVVRGFKRAVTIYAKRNNIPFQWQSSYYDIIIRTREQLYHTQQYIIENPENWETDKYYM